MTEDSGVKVPYEPTQKARWEVAGDPDSQARYTAVLKTRENIQRALSYIGDDKQEHSLSIGISLHGSLSKGKVLSPETRKKSDVDMVIYFDTDELHQHYSQIQLAQLGGSFDREYRQKMLKIYQDNFGTQENNIEREYGGRGGKAAYSGAVMAIIECIETGFAGVGDIDVAKNIGRGIKILPIAMNGRSSIFEKIRWEMQELANPKTDPKLLEKQYMRVANYFHMDVGGGMRKYIQGMLTDMASLDGGEREKMWRFIRQCAEKAERGGDFSEQVAKEFPYTYEEACEYYGLQTFSIR